MRAERKEFFLEIGLVIHTSYTARYALSMCYVYKPTETRKTDGHENTRRAILGKSK
jgi:hypothetical protein